MKLRQSQKEKEKTIKIVWFKEPFTLSGKTRVKFGNLSCHNSLRFFCYQVKFKLAVADFISSIYCTLLFRKKNHTLKILDEIFEVIVEKVVTCWSGSVEAGAFLLLVITIFSD